MELTHTGERGHLDAVLALDLSSDGATLASSGVDGTVKLWRLDEPKLAKRIQEADASYAAARAAGAAAATSSHTPPSAAEAMRGTPPFAMQVNP